TIGRQNPTRNQTKNELPLIFATTPVARPKKKSRTRNDKRRSLSGSGPAGLPRLIRSEADQHDEGEEDQLEDESDDLKRKPEGNDQREHRDRQVQPGMVHAI